MTIDKEKIRVAAMEAIEGDSEYFEWLVTPPTILSLLDALDKAEKGRDEALAALERAVLTIETAVSNCFTEYSHRQVMEDPSHFVNAAINSVKGGK